MTDDSSVVTGVQASIEPNSNFLQIGVILPFDQFIEIKITAL